MAGYATPAWTNNATPAIDATALTNIGEGVELSEHPFGVCSTASSTAAKTVTVDFSGTLTLFTGLTVRVQFTHANTASSPTLNVNSTGAIPIMHGTSTAVSSAWVAGAVVQFTYDGTNWVIDQPLPVADWFASEIIKVNLGTQISSGLSVTWSKSDARITADHAVISYEFGNPLAQAAALQWTTSAGAIQVQGAVNGTTSLTVYLGIVGTTIT